MTVKICNVTTDLTKERKFAKARFVAPEGTLSFAAVAADHTVVMIGMRKLGVALASVTGNEWHGILMRACD